VSALDNLGRIVPGYTGTVHFTTSDPQALLPADYTFTASNSGVHAFANGVTLFTAGTQTVTATDTTSGIGGSATITIIPATPPAESFFVSAPDAVGAGSPFTVSVTALDAQSQVATGYTGTVHFTSSDAHPGVLPADYSFTSGDNGVHLFSGVTLYTAGVQTVTVQDGSIAVTASITVVAAPASHFAVAAPASSIAGASFEITITAIDPYGNVDTRYGGTAIVFSSDRYPQLVQYSFTPADQGTHSLALSLFTAGSQTISVRDAGNSSILGTTTVAVQAAAADQFVLEAPPNASSGMPFELIVAAVDPYGNIATNYVGAVHVRTSDMDPGIVLPADYTFTSSDAGVHAFAISLVTPGPEVLVATDTENGITGSATVVLNPNT
jgi:hypothetical protein